MTILAIICIAEALALMAAGYWIWDLNDRLDEEKIDAIEARASYYIICTRIEELRDKLKEESE